MADEDYTPGELMRGIRRIEQAVADMGTRFVPMELYARDRKEHSDDIAELRGENKQLQADVKAARLREDETRAKTRTMWLTLLAVPTAGAVLWWVFQGGLAQ